MPSLRLSMLLAVATLAGCATTVKIQTEYDPAAPYPAYRKYAWLNATPGPEQAAAMRNPAAYAMVVGALDRELAKKGFEKTTLEGNPDFVVAVLGNSQQRIEVTNYGYAYGGAYAYGPYGPGMVVAAPEVRSYTDGTLLVDFVDAKSKKLFWRGTATDTVTSPDSLKASIDDAARQLVAAFPPALPKK
jgi:hypothetical protein